MATQHLSYFISRKFNDYPVAGSTLQA
ncbi:gp129 [Brochothrix phage A9]|uniref:Gp129 n=1 Tax=Brochothrix phage A9 TaxID=857312 RepID=D9J0S6_9CAUD|nr:gp129 [Brochothrix phage A9]ADJ53163.1 gp129 [Brochothrix phage A9]